MANRGMSADMLAEIAKDKVSICHLVTLGFTTPIFITNAYKNITVDFGPWGLLTWQNNGYLLEVPDITESVSIQVDKFNVVLSGAEQSVIQTLFTDSPINKLVDIYLGFLDTAGDLVADPLQIFKGMIDSFSISDNPNDGNTSVILAISSYWADFERVNGFKTNNEHQQSSRYYPGDRGLEFCSKVIKDLQWGKS